MPSALHEDEWHPLIPSPPNILHRN
jgi:hypothetical protein